MYISLSGFNGSLRLAFVVRENVCVVWGEDVKWSELVCRVLAFKIVLAWSTARSTPGAHVPAFAVSAGLFRWLGIDSPTFVEHEVGVLSSAISAL